MLGSNRTPANNCNATIIKKFKCFLNYKLNVKPGFYDLENMGKDTKSDFLSQILRKLWGIEYPAHLGQTAISFFAYMTEKLLKGAGVTLP